jgi:hypothetical protein
MVPDAGFINPAYLFIDCANAVAPREQRSLHLSHHFSHP